MNQAHCWHDCGYSLSVLPPIHPEQCCRCGTRRQKTYQLVPAGSQHGPFLPRGIGQLLDESAPVYTGGDGPCEPPEPPTYQPSSGG